MPATVWFGGGNAIKDSIKYKYDSCGNICQITENGHLTAKYTYDSLNRLIREDNKALNRTVLYTYDNNGAKMLKLNIILSALMKNDFLAMCGDNVVKNADNTPALDGLIGIYEGKK